eukprot:g69821.t1
MPGPHGPGTRGPGVPPRPVVCVETGEVFPSIAAAARRIGMHRSSIQSSLTRGIRAGQYHWAYQDYSHA